ncbi:nuclear transport factor 2 family protein [Amycolatopsis australiensis]|uniref:SnoaL-like domain-containing protein n=1 Tax=Amycolatopsis australiensis TaxID=546364 RepID=A0A1K1RGA9_9PSEU|nr:nuclear transport factor 2 family protein [Amycolatopsis australiensis]SFW70710.1 SnoaL-like domain-containing protein [Amycolatopsis australiensis]
MRHTDVAREEIAELLGDLFAGFESRDWNRLAQLVGEKVHLDHTSLGAPAAEELTGAELVARWRRGLHERKKNFHLLSHPRIKVDGGHAEVAVNCYACNILDAGLGGGVWECWGRHDIAWHHTEKGWKATSFVFTKAHTRGDDRIHTHTLD